MSGRSQTTHTTIANVDAEESAARSSCPAKRAEPLAMLAIAGFLLGASFQVAAAADPDHVFANCTFDLDDLKLSLQFTDTSETPIQVSDLEASYILIYVRQNPNDGQQIGTSDSYTGPVLCVNSGTESITPTTETTLIPNSTNHGAATSVDILGAEEALHLQYLLNFSGGPGVPPGDVEKRVCHTVAGNTECFLIQPLVIP